MRVRAVLEERSARKIRRYGTGQDPAGQRRLRLLRDRPEEVVHDLVVVLVVPRSHLRVKRLEVAGRHALPNRCGRSGVRCLPGCSTRVQPSEERARPPNAQARGESLAPSGWPRESRRGTQRDWRLDWGERQGPRGRSDEKCRAHRCLRTPGRRRLQHHPTTPWIPSLHKRLCATDRCSPRRACQARVVAGWRWLFSPGNRGSRGHVTTPVAGPVLRAVVLALALSIVCAHVPGSSAGRMDFKFNFALEDDNAGAGNEAPPTGMSATGESANDFDPSREITVLGKEDELDEEAVEALFEEVPIQGRTAIRRCRPPSDDSLPDELKNAIGSSDLVPGVYEGGFKVWECSIDLVELLVRDKVEFSGKKVIELGCGHGLPGIHALQEGATVDFQDYNAEVLQEVGARSHGICSRFEALQPCVHP